MAFQTVKGTKDILPGDIRQWQRLEEIFREISRQFGFSEIRTPILEYTELFTRGIGENTDVVGKEMYHLQSKDGITLRPELTAGVARAIVQHTLCEQNGTLRLWYSGAMFRHERPQLGRQRQFHQYGAEFVGSPFPESDVETILLASEILRNVGLAEFELHLNSLGNSQSRENYRNALVEFLTPIAETLSPESQLRLLKNPLRILDSKDKLDAEAVKNAPNILEFLDEESRVFFDLVRNLLTKSGVSFVMNPRLVRGLDYYSHTAFEFVTTRLGAQNAIGGGGRYDGLFEQIGGKRIPAVGFAFGIERLLLLLAEEGKTLDENQAIDCYIIGLDDESREIAFKIAQDLRRNKLSVITDVQRRSFKAQMREANKLNAEKVIIIGENERLSGKFIVKTMSTGEQSEMILQEILIGLTK